MCRHGWGFKAAFRFCHHVLCTNASPSPPKSSILLLCCGEDSSLSTPTSPGEAGVPSGTGGGQEGSLSGSQESVRGRHRLQRQMAQSRKTFRFRKSKHGHHVETQERTPQVAHIEVEPARLPPMTTGQIVGGEDPALRELSVPYIAKDDFPSQTRASLKRDRQRPGVIQPEPESASEISYMETSTISGYRESFGGFDMSLQELERLEMQVRTGKYKEPLSAQPGPTRKTGVAETRFQEPTISREQVETQDNKARNNVPPVVPPPTSWGHGIRDVRETTPRNISETIQHQDHETHSLQQHSYPHSVSPKTSEMPYPSRGSQMVQVSHDIHQVSKTSSSLQYATEHSHIPQVAHSHQIKPDTQILRAHSSQPQVMHHTEEMHSIHPASGYRGQQLETLRSTQLSHGTRSVHSAISTHPGKSNLTVHFAQPTHSELSHHTPATRYHSSHGHSTRHDEGYSGSHIQHPGDISSYGQYPTPLSHSKRSYPEYVHATHTHPYSSLEPRTCSSHATQHKHSIQVTDSSHSSSHSQPTVWRHSWTEGETKEQRVWDTQDTFKVRLREKENQFKSVKESEERHLHSPGRQQLAAAESVPVQEWKDPNIKKGDDNGGACELSSLLRRLERRTPSEQSLLVAFTERDEDTLI
ncbi:hypothetical protein SK128_001020 [Halocaridina rubra]|uniref:Uncharacterized protein n=1 Tax=Halocaridina rubra TaxID=373956 RepID=A0AAN8WP10_HALRR